MFRRPPARPRMTKPDHYAAVLVGPRLGRGLRLSSSRSAGGRRRAPSAPRDGRGARRSRQRRRGQERCAFHPGERLPDAAARSPEREVGRSAGGPPSPPGRSALQVETRGSSPARVAVDDVTAGRGRRALADLETAERESRSAAAAHAPGAGGAGASVPRHHLGVAQRGKVPRGCRTVAQDAAGSLAPPRPPPGFLGHVKYHVRVSAFDVVVPSQEKRDHLVAELAVARPSRFPRHGPGGAWTGDRRGPRGRAAFPR